VIVQFCGEAPLQSTTQSVFPWQSKVQVHPLPHLNMHGLFEQSWLQHPFMQVEQFVPHPLLLDAAELCAVELCAVELDAVLAPPMPALLLFIPLLDVKLPAIPLPLEAMDPLVVEAPPTPVDAN